MKWLQTMDGLTLASHFFPKMLPFSLYEIQTAIDALLIETIYERTHILTQVSWLGILKEYYEMVMNLINKTASYINITLQPGFYIYCTKCSVSLIMKWNFFLGFFGRVSLLA